MEFEVRLYQDEDNVWIAEIPVVPGCVSQGATEEEAMANVEDALKGCLAARKAHGMPPIVQIRSYLINAS